MPLYKWKRELLFISSSPFRTLPNLFNYTIFDEFISGQVVAELMTRVIYGRNQQVKPESSHLGLVTRVESFVVFDSSRVAEN
jgi:hypothetical protein